MTRIHPIRRTYALLALTLLATASVVVRAETDDAEEFVVIKAARVITISGDELLDAQIILVNGKVRLVGRNLEYPRSAKVIDAGSETVMPGMIHVRTRWRLVGYTRSGLHADRDVARELYLDEIDFQPLLRAGFTAVCFYPDGTGLPGSAGVYRTVASGEKKSRELGAAYLRVTMTSPSRDKKVLRDAVAKARAAIEKVAKARKAWEEKQKKAKQEDDKKKEAQGAKPATAAEEEKKDDETEEDDKQPEVFTPPAIAATLLPLVEWLRDEKGSPLLFELSDAADLVHLDQLLSTVPELPGSLLYLAESSSSGYHQVIDELAQRQAVVLLRPRIGSLPYTSTRYNLPGELAAAGCTIVLMPTSDSTSSLMAFRGQLADLVRAGLPRRIALESATVNAARLLGIDDRLGTIEKDKDADLIFLDGDPLDPAARVIRVMTLGEIVWEASK